MGVVQSAEETGMADHILLTNYLLRIAIAQVSYIRGLFPEKCFSESVLSAEIKNEKIMTGENDLGRLIDLVEKGVSDALQKKYLKTLLFSICEKEEGPMIEEYAFSFSYPTLNTEAAMIISQTGSTKGITAFIKPNASKLTPDQMRMYGCKMIRTLVSLMKTGESKPKIDETTVRVKLIYNDEITPEDYWLLCAKIGAINLSNKNHLKMEVGNVNSKNLVLSLKIKDVLDPCDDNNTKSRWDESRLDNDFDIDGDLGETQLYGKTFGYILCTAQKNLKFILDSGATHHICNDKNIMCNLREVKKEDQLSMYTADGKETSAELMGSIDLKNFSLSPVGLIPSMDFNVVSIGQLANQGLMICCGNSQFSIYDVKGAKIVGEGYLDSRANEYVFRTMKWSPESDRLIAIPKSTHEVNDEQEVSVEQQVRKVWLIDTGCARHLVPDVSSLTNVNQDRQPFKTAKGKTIMSSHRGKFKSGNLVLNDVLCCKSVRDNLMSGPALDKAGYRITFFGKSCTLVHKDGLELRGVAVQDTSSNTYVLTPEEEEGNFDRVSAQGDTKDAKRRRLE